MVASSPVRMQDQNHAMMQVSPVQIHHQYVHHAESPVGVLQPQALQFSMPLPSAAAPAVSWSNAVGPSCLQPVVIVDDGGAAGTTTSLVLDDSDLDVTPSTAAFQQLLDSFGCQSDVDDDVDDDTVVSLDESLSLHATARHIGQSTRPFRHHHHQQQHQRLQHHVVCSAARC